MSLYQTFVQCELKEGVGMTKNPNLNMRIAAQRWNEINGVKGSAGAANVKPAKPAKAPNAKK